MNKKMLFCVFLLALFVGSMCNFLYAPIQVVEEELNASVSLLTEEGFRVVDKQRVRGYSSYMRVFHDNTRNVTCWKLGNGLSCIPDYMLEEAKR